MNYEKFGGNYENKSLFFHSYEIAFRYAHHIKKSTEAARPHW